MMPFQISNLLNGENNALSDMLKAIPILETRSRYYQNLSYAPSNMSIPYRHRVSAYRIKWRFAFSPNEIEIFVPRMRSPKMQP